MKMTDSTRIDCSKSEYLKRYLSKDSSSKKKRKKRIVETAVAVKTSAVRSKIVDDDLDLKAFPPCNDDDYMETGDDAPQIVGVIDERPFDMRDQAHLWRVVGSDKQPDASDDESGIFIGQPNDDADNSGRNRPESSSQRMRHDSSDSDRSPPRESHHSSSQRVRHDSSDSSKSPGRHKEANTTSSHNSLPKRKSRHDSDSDQSPSRSTSRKDGSNQLSPRSPKSGSDQSPPRSKKYDSDQSPSRSKKCDSDQSPSRSKKYDSDQSPPRQKSYEKPLQNATAQGSHRKRRSSRDLDLSPPRSKRESSRPNDHASSENKHRDRHHSKRKDETNSKHFSRKSHNRSHSDSESSPPLKKGKKDDGLQRKTLDGKKAGLQDSKTLKLENEAAKRREKKLFETMSDEISGKNAEVIVRDRATGKRRNLEEERKKILEEEAVKAEREAQYNKWGRGLKQIELQKSRIEQDIHEISKPLARYEDDVDLDKALREQEREGDPMLAFIKKKKALKNPTSELPKYKGPEPPPNRYRILPGYRWDGVDRSNGFEKSRFVRLTSKVADEIEAYKWSVEDM